MNATTADGGWKQRALAGSPDFLNDVRAGAVTWNQLWAFYRQSAADPGAVLALSGFFHVVQCRRYEREGSVLDGDGRVGSDLQEWARFVVDCEEAVPEVRLRESLAGLLGMSLIGPLYYEVVFGSYLDARLEQQEALAPGTPCSPEVPRPDRCSRAPGQLAVRLREHSRSRQGADDGAGSAALAALLDRHYPGWEAAYTQALGDRAGEQFDDGGEA